MEVSLKKAFSILDGRLSTNMDDIYDMLNYISSSELTTLALTFVMKSLKEKNPQWFQDGKNLLDKIKEEEGTNDFEQLMKIIDSKYSNTKIKLQKL